MGGLQRPAKKRQRDSLPAIARANKEPEHVGLVPREKADGHRSRDVVTQHGDKCRAQRRIYQCRELHELPFDVIESGAATAAFRKASDVVAVLQPQAPERLNSQRGIDLDNAQRHASPMAAGSIAAFAACS